MLETPIWVPANRELRNAYRLSFNNVRQHHRGSKTAGALESGDKRDRILTRQGNSLADKFHAAARLVLVVGFAFLKTTCQALKRRRGKHYKHYKQMSKKGGTDLSSHKISHEAQKDCGVINTRASPI